MNTRFSRLVDVITLFVIFNLSFVVTSAQRDSMGIAAPKQYLKIKPAN